MVARHSMDNPAHSGTFGIRFGTRQLTQETGMRKPLSSPLSGDEFAVPSAQYMRGQFSHT